jgi:CRISPR-associated protein Csd1
MLRELVEYAHANQLEPEPGVELGKEVHWAIEVSSTGTFAGISRLGQADAKGRIKSGIRVEKAPSTPGMNSGGKSHVIVETADVVIGLGEQDLDPKKREKLKEKQEFYLSQLQSLSAVLADAWPAYQMLTNAEAREAAATELARRGAKATDKVCPSIEGTLLVNRPEWLNWWRGVYARLRERPNRGASRTMICLATGEEVDPAPTHDMIKGVPGGQAMGSAIVSFDKAPFQSFGLDKSANAAVGPQAVSAYKAAFEDLLRNHKTRMEDLTIVHWYRDTPKLQDDPLEFLTDPDEEAVALGRVRELHAAIHTGKRPDLLRARYFALGLSANAARIMIRDWRTGSFTELIDSVLAWFDDLQLADEFGGVTRPPKFRLALTAAGVKKGKDDFDLPPPSVAAALWNAAIRGTHAPIPASVLARLVQYERAFMAHSTQITPLRLVRLGLMRAYHNRKFRAPSPSATWAVPSTLRQGSPMSQGLDTEHPDPAYHCGRLLACVAQLQEAAQGDVGASIVGRFYASASATPALVFGRILRGSQHHLAKLDGGLSHLYAGRIAEITTRIADIPRTLDLERQSLFALGFYHQTAFDRAARAQNKAEKEARKKANEQPA